MTDFAVIQLERKSKTNHRETCNLGIDHVVPDIPECVWVVSELKDGDDLDAAKRRAFKTYPALDGWTVRWGTSRAVKV